MLPLALLLLASPNTNSVQLRVNVKPGDAFEYRLTIRPPEHPTVYTQIRLTCKSAAHGKFRFLAKASDTESSREEAAQSMSGSDAVTLDARGRFVQIKGDHIKSGFGIVLPKGRVWVGAKWTDRTANGVDHYRLLQLATFRGVQAAQISRISHGNEIQAWIDQKTGMMFRLEANSDFAGIKGSISLERVYPPLKPINLG
jgi:hypothetical protein